MFRNVPECSGMFRNVPCSGFYRRPGTEASFGTTVITATILSIISILFSRMTVNVLVFVLHVVFFHTMLCVGILRYQQVLC